MEHLDANNLRALSHSVFPPGDRARYVSAVPVHVDEGRVGVGVVAKMDAALEVGMVFPAPGVDHVGIGTGAGGGVVDIVGGSRALIGEVA